MNYYYTQIDPTILQQIHYSKCPKYPKRIVKIILNHLIYQIPKFHQD